MATKIYCVLQKNIEIFHFCKAGVFAQFTAHIHHTNKLKTRSAEGKQYSFVLENFVIVVLYTISDKPLKKYISIILKKHFFALS